MRQSLMASVAAPFAHLMGLPPRAAASTPAAVDPHDTDEGDDPDTDDHDLDGDSPNEDDPDGKKGKKGKKAKGEDPKPDETAEDEDDDTSMAAPETDDDKKAYRAGHAAGRLAERARVDAIFSSAAATGRAPMAAQIACKTALSAKEAIGLLASSPMATTVPGLAERMGGVEIPNVGSDTGAAVAKPTGAQATADAIIAAGKLRRGETA